MPSTYAHYRFGKEVQSRVGEKIQKVIAEEPQLFQIGIHGADILFYYHPLCFNPVNLQGYGCHEKPGKEFFAPAKKVIQQQGFHNAYLSYIYGFICHFALDVTCHGYIDEKIAASGISHTEIEVEFDRALMIADGLDPIHQCLTGHIVPSEENAQVIGKFFPGVSDEQVRKSLRGMIFYNDLLVAPSRLKRMLIYMLLRITGNYREMHGLLVNYEENPECADSTKHLTELYREAVELAVRLICEYEKYLYGDEPLDPIYDYTFGTQLPERRKQDEIQTDENREKLGAL